MPLATTAELVASAHSAGSGLAAYNVITLEHAEAIVAGAERASRPVILQISENAVKFHRGQVKPIVAAVTAVAREAEIAVSVHLDHVEDETLLHASADAGASSVMFDASKLDYDANVAATKAAADWAHERGLFLEAELGEVGGKDGAHAPGVRTDPQEAAAFAAATGVDALAVAVGSSHAMATRTASLDFDLIARLHSAVPVPLVLHGSSGVADEDLRKAVSAGITKINVGTILNVAFTGSVRSILAADGTLIDPRKYLAPARDAVAGTVASITVTIS
ncbi:fructose-bisphosphate aldolase class II [Rhodococcus sp. 27YEA15]|uniref:class II fructose-bisphosphate aldolase n=1 Tax=Rhodococcus sp. 27YEA15 TaxID=3156259 RepID=UPI003C7D8596